MQVDEKKIGKQSNWMKKRKKKKKKPLTCNQPSAYGYFLPSVFSPF